MKPSRILAMSLALAAFFGAELLYVKTTFGAPKAAKKFIIVNHVFYSCNGNKQIEARFYEGKPAPNPKTKTPPAPIGKVRLVLSDGRRFVLPQTLSASGIRYANKDESFEFWSKGNTAFILEHDKETYSGCVAVSLY